MMAGNFVISIVLSASLNLLWSLLNSLQVIVTLPLLKTNFPSNAYFLCQTLNKVANFNVIPMEALNRMILVYEDTKPKNENFERYTYASKNFILNSELLIYGFNAWLFLAVVVWPLSKILTPMRFMWAKQFLEEFIFYKFLLRFLLESYLELYLCTFINFEKLLWTTSGEIVGSLACIFFFGVYTALPFLTHYLIVSNRSFLGVTRFRK